MAPLLHCPSSCFCHTCEGHSLILPFSYAHTPHAIFHSTLLTCEVMHTCVHFASSALMPSSPKCSLPMSNTHTVLFLLGFLTPASFCTHNLPQTSQETDFKHKLDPDTPILRIPQSWIITRKKRKIPTYHIGSLATLLPHWLPSYPNTTGSFLVCNRGSISVDGTKHEFSLSASQHKTG